jgi:hypothetical protein
MHRETAIAAPSVPARLTYSVLAALVDRRPAAADRGLRDRAYTWTASAYLILAAAHVRRDLGIGRSL